MKKVKSGEKFQVKANTWNAFIDAAHYVKNQSANLKSNSNSFARNSVFVKVINDSGENWDIFTPLILTEPLKPIENAEDALKFAGQIPVFKAETYAGNSGTIGITQEVIEDGKIGKVMIAGISPVRLESELPINLIWQQENWGIVNLGSGDTGYSGPFKIVSSEVGLEVINGFEPEDIYAGYALFNGKPIAIESGYVLSTATGYVCLVIEAFDDEEPLVYYDIFSDITTAESTVIYPLGYAEIDEESETTKITQFYHAMPQLWLTEECQFPTSEEPVEYE